MFPVHIPCCLWHWWGFLDQRSIYFFKGRGDRVVLEVDFTQPSKLVSCDFEREFRDVILIPNPFEDKQVIKSLSNSCASSKSCKTKRFSFTERAGLNDKVKVDVEFFRDRFEFFDERCRGIVIL